MGIADFTHVELYLNPKLLIRQLRGVINYRSSNLLQLTPIISI
jgi:hypothetical protein